jgi:hypothetical protein
LLSYCFKILNLIILTCFYTFIISILLTNKRIKTPSLIKKLKLLLLSLKPSLLKNCLTIKNYSFNACFSLYNAFFSLRYISFISLSLRKTCLISSCSLRSFIRIVSLSRKFKNTILILIKSIFKSSFIALANRIHRVIYCTANTNVSK